MTLSQLEYDAIIADETKRIEGDISWTPGQNPLAMMFRHNVNSDKGFPLFLQGWYNPYSGKLSYAIIYHGVGRIYGLDLGADHINPDGRAIGETHKNYWTPENRDTWAYVPEDITSPWDRPVEVWEQFCVEVNLEHRGVMHPPHVQGEIIL